jgi:hypothetical protein
MNQYRKQKNLAAVKPCTDAAFCHEKLLELKVTWKNLNAYVWFSFFKPSFDSCFKSLIWYTILHLVSMANSCACTNGFSSLARSSGRSLLVDEMNIHGVVFVSTPHGIMKSSHSSAVNGVAYSFHQCEPLTLSSYNSSVTNYAHRRKENEAECDFTCCQTKNSFILDGLWTRVSSLPSPELRITFDVAFVYVIWNLRDTRIKSCCCNFDLRDAATRTVTTWGRMTSLSTPVTAFGYFIHL